MSEEGKEPLQASPGPGQLSLAEFQRMALRTGVIVEAQDHPHADRLLILKVDLGEGSPRQLVAGIRGAYHADQLIGKHVVVVTNLKSAVLRGVESQGMALAATDESGVVLLTLDRPVSPGSTVR